MMDREALEAYVLGTAGAVKGVYEVYKPINTEERIETAALALTLGSFAVMGAIAVKKAIDRKP